MEIDEFRLCPLIDEADYMIRCLVSEEGWGGCRQGRSCRFRRAVMEIALGDKPDVRFRIGWQNAAKSSRALPHGRVY